MGQEKMIEVTNDRVASKVMGWEKVRDNMWRTGASTLIGRFSPLTSGNDDLKVLRVARTWIERDDRFDQVGRYNLFYRRLSEVLRSRDPYYDDTVNQFELYYMDNYQIGDFARAALEAVVSTPDARSVAQEANNVEIPHGQWFRSSWSSVWNGPCLQLIVVQNGRSSESWAWTARGWREPDECDGAGVDGWVKGDGQKSCEESAMKWYLSKDE